MSVCGNPSFADVKDMIRRTRSYREPGESKTGQLDLSVEMAYHSHSPSWRYRFMTDKDVVQSAWPSKPLEGHNIYIPSMRYTSHGLISRT